MTDTIRDQAEQIASLKEALEDLIDAQNGAPLYTYRKAWNEAMAKAAGVLGRSDEQVQHQAEAEK